MLLKEGLSESFLGVAQVRPLSKMPQLQGQVFES